MSETLTRTPADLPEWAPEPPVSAATPPAPVPAPSPASAFAPRAPRRALSITSLVLGGLGVVGSWIPVVNAFSIGLGVGGLALGIPALVLARRGRQGAKGLAVTGVVLSSVTVVVAVVANVLFGLAVAASAESAPAPSPAPVSSSTADAALLDVGTSAVVGDYAVTVQAVEPDADGLMSMEDPDAGPAAGQYVLASFDVVYRGAAQGDAWLDLSAAFHGADGVAYDELDCAAVPSDSPTYLPALASGDTASYSLCFDVPADAIDGGRVVVHEEASSTTEPVSWSAR